MAIQVKRILTAVFFGAMASFLFACSADAATLSRPVNNLGLVGWWTFDNSDMTSNVRDRSGSGFTGYLLGQTSTSTIIGKMGQALYFDGADDYVHISNFSWPGGPVTVSFWSYVSGTPVGQGSAFGQEAGCVARFQAHAPWTDDKIYWDYGNCGGTGRISTSYSGYYGKWTLVTLVSAGLGGNFKAIYLDGVLAASDATPITEGQSASTNFDIGSYYDGASSRNYQTGSIDDFRLYNRVLTSGEIKSLYNSTVTKFSTSYTPPGLKNGLIGHWTFDGADMASLVRDVTGQGNSAVIINQTSTTTAPGKLGQGLLFDGVNDYVSTINAFAFPSPNFSISTWFKGQEGLMSQISGGGSSQWILNLSTTLGPRFYDDNNGWTSNATPIVSTEWYHAVIVGTSSNLKIYINGSLFSNTARSTFSPLGAPTTGLNIGYSGGTGTFSNGIFDDTRIYNRALSDSEVSQLYAMGGSKVNTSQTNAGRGLTSGLVGWWTFDGKDMTPNVRDKSGLGNHGGLVGQTSTTTAIGKLGQALQFDGSDDNVVVTNESNFDFDTNSPFSISAWVKHERFDGAATIIAKEQNGGNYPGFQFDISGTNLYLRLLIMGANGVPAYASSPETSMPIGVWKHAVATYDGSGTSAGIQLYIDGVLSASTNTGNLSASPLNDWDPTIGINPPAGGSQFKGLMDDLRVYNRVLSANEVKQLYNQGK